MDKGEQETNRTNYCKYILGIKSGQECEFHREVEHTYGD